MKQEAWILVAALTDDECPALPRLVGILVLAYALSPLDLIPDFIPILGLIDDLILIPAGILFVRRLLPPELLDKAREKGNQSDPKLEKMGQWIVICLWLIAAFSVGVFVLTGWRKD
ncbi:DUF1232 domain-containing protein [Kamptonema cortianum]|nr:DUF1232 domain-containing protein [Geitlerinema splendidum]MDK3155314.1 DUF1232 domain-containing protein [Kamptonema cortianum]